MSKQNKSELEKAEERAVNITGPIDLSNMKPFCNCENPQLRFSLYETRCENCGETDVAKMNFPQPFGKATHIDLTSPRKDKREFTKKESREMADFLVELYYQHEHNGLPLPKKLSRQLDGIRDMLTKVAKRSR